MKIIRVLLFMFTTCLLFVCNNDTAYAESKLEPVLTSMPGPSFHVVSRFSEGLMATEIDDKPCYIDESGAVAISYEKLQSVTGSKTDRLHLGEFVNGTALISELLPIDEYSGSLTPLLFIDRRGDIASKVENPELFQWEATYNPNVSYPSIYGNYYYLDIAESLFSIHNTVNSQVIKLDKAYRPNYNIYDEKMSVFNEKTEKHGYIDKAGDVVIECKFDWAYPFIDGYALTQTNGVYKFIDMNGNYISDLEWKSGFMNCDASRPDVLFQYTGTGVQLIKIELAEVKDGIVNRPVKIFINNELVRFDKQPQIVNGRVVVPVKSICDDLSLRYSLESGVLTINYEDSALTHKISEDSFSINGTAENYGVKSYLSDNNIFIPIKAISSLLKADIFWNPDSKTITMNY